jgi:metal-responsive CopG/Arc/MetJ family transcriptional regulator
MGPHQSITLWIPQDLVRRVDEIAQAAEVNRSQTIAALLADYLAGD